ncbi:hypothetical protein TNIN_336951 [Trichonephila inaurata madagascariensis]|uniref:Uncharacterized protein n=1 Tax=Trichonephila inaurata madagascariensis TaxID=2747483 RepID=A0A8X6WN27_9ARAC|nr:hypothetical protein TNIN_336951 [Trichonephila inaurata madagascariensis]
MSQVDQAYSTQNLSLGLQAAYTPGIRERNKKFFFIFPGNGLRTVVKRIPKTPPNVTEVYVARERKCPTRQGERIKKSQRDPDSSLRRKDAICNGHRNRISLGCQRYRAGVSHSYFSPPVRVHIAICCWTGVGQKSIWERRQQDGQKRERESEWKRSGGKTYAKRTGQDKNLLKNIYAVRSKEGLARKSGHSIRGPLLSEPCQSWRRGIRGGWSLMPSREI